MADEGKLIKYLLEWAEHYFKSRDAFSKKIKSFEMTDGKLIINYPDKKDTIVAISNLDTMDIAAIGDNFSIITLNNKANVDVLFKKWNQFSANKALKIYFVNPLSNTDKRWIISPNVHAKICEESALKSGLYSMSESVEQISADTLNAKL